MIRLEKLSLPQDVADAIAERTRQAKVHLDAGESIPDSLVKQYRNRDVKDLLKTETSCKCAYCESKVTAVYWGDVEHIAPRSIHPELTFEYDNLTLACAVCNNGKRAYADPSTPLVNPYVDDPADYLLALGPIIKGFPGNSRGFATEVVLKLNRQDLIERRHERLERLSHLVTAFVMETSVSRKTLLQMQLVAEVANDKEYAFVARAFIQNLAGITVP